MLSYNRVTFSKIGEAFQEIEDGRVVRYVDESGAELFINPPVGENCKVTATTIKPTEGMEARAIETRKPYDVEREGDRRRADRRQPAKRETAEIEFEVAAAAVDAVEVKP